MEKVSKQPLEVARGLACITPFDAPKYLNIPVIPTQPPYMEIAFAEITSPMHGQPITDGVRTASGLVLITVETMLQKPEWSGLRAETQVIMTPLVHDREIVGYSAAFKPHVTHEGHVLPMSENAIQQITEFTTEFGAHLSKQS